MYVGGQDRLVAVSTATCLRRRSRFVARSATHKPPTLVCCLRVSCLLPTKPEIPRPHFDMQQWLVSRYGVLQKKDRVQPRLTCSLKSNYGLVLIISEQLSLGLSACLVQTGSCLCHNKITTLSWHFASTEAARLFPDSGIESFIVIAMPLQGVLSVLLCCPKNSSEGSTDALGSNPRLEFRSLPEPVSGTREAKLRKSANLGLKVKYAISETI